MFYYHSFEEASNLAIHGQLSEDLLASLDSNTSSIYQHSLLSAPQYFSRLLNHTLEDIYSELFPSRVDSRFFSLRQRSSLNPELMLHVVSIYEDMQYLHECSVSISPLQIIASRSCHNACYLQATLQDISFSMKFIESRAIPDPESNLIVLLDVFDLALFFRDSSIACFAQTYFYIPDIYTSNLSRFKVPDFMTPLDCSKTSEFQGSLYGLHATY